MAFYNRRTLSPHERAMMENTQAQLIQMQIQAIEQAHAIAPTESGKTASRPYSAGDYFFLDGVFCKAKVAIAQGSRFTKDTNYETKVLAVELAALSE